MQTWFAESFRKYGGLPAATAQNRLEANDQGPVAVTHIGLGSRSVSRTTKFIQAIVVWNWSILRESALWAPASMLKPIRDCPIKSCAVSPGLSATYNLQIELVAQIRRPNHGTVAPYRAIH